MKWQGNEKKTKNDNIALKAGMWYTICNFLLKALSFLTLPLYTRLLSQEDFGLYSVITTWISVLLPVVTLNFYSSVNLAKFDFQKEFNQYISAVTLLGFGITFIIYLCAICFADKVCYILGIPGYALHIIFIHLLFYPSMDILQAKMRSEMRYRPIIAITIISALASTVIAFTATIIMNEKLLARILGTYIPFLIIDFMIFIYIVKKGGKPGIKWRKYWKYGISISAPLVIHYFASTIINSSDKIMIQKMCGEQDVAIYSVAYSCAALVNLLRNSLSGAWTPWTFEQVKSGKLESLKKNTYYYVLFFGIICLGIILVAPEIIYIAGGETYASAKFAIPPVVMGYVFSMVYGFYSNIELFYKKQKWFALFAIISASFNIILNYIFIPVFGYIAAGYTTLVSCAVECGLHYYNVWKMGMTKLYDTKFNVIFLIFGTIVTIVSNYLYLYNKIRYIIIIIFLIIILTFLIIHRNNIKNLVMSVIK